MDLETFNQAKYPKCIKQILILSGYDNYISLRAIDEEKLFELEQYVNQNRSILDDLRCCFTEIYRNQETFSFVLGHKAIILSIPEQIKAVLAKSKKTRSRKPKSLEQLQKLLINQLNNYPSKIGFTIPNGSISELNIKNMQSEKTDDGATIIQCEFSCPFCTKSIPVKYKGTGGQATLRNT